MGCLCSKPPTEKMEPSAGGALETQKPLQQLARLTSGTVGLVPAGHVYVDYNTMLEAAKAKLKGRRVGSTVELHLSPSFSQQQTAEAAAPGTYTFERTATGIVGFSDSWRSFLHPSGDGGMVFDWAGFKDLTIRADY